MSEYNNISVFKAKASENPKAPLFNVVIEMSNGEKFRGGLWKKVSKNGLEYLSGTLEEDDGQGGGGQRKAPAAKPAQDSMVDW